MNGVGDAVGALVGASLGAGVGKYDGAADGACVGSSVATTNVAPVLVNVVPERRFRPGTVTVRVVLVVLLPVLPTTPLIVVGPELTTIGVASIRPTTRAVSADVTVSGANEIETNVSIVPSVTSIPPSVSASRLELRNVAVYCSWTVR